MKMPSSAIRTMIALLLCIMFLATNAYHLNFRPFSLKAKRYEQFTTQSMHTHGKPFSTLLYQTTESTTKGFFNETALVLVDLNEELKTSFMSYAFSTILGRALPDARDGLKPVHRRVLYAMKVLNLTPDSSYRKCARIVGEVLGKYHPHGDQSVYDALVRMAQDFVMMHPLISGHGNFGSIDNDPPAAMRYTEAKLSQIAYEALLADIDEDTVDFNPNFDGNEIEPLVLPARLPILLINGANGIAVGMATSIPPHNLNEVIDAMIALIDNPALAIGDLMEIIPAPDFPTGGEIVGLKGARDFFSKGQGSITIRGKATIEKVSSASSSKGNTRAKNTIIITELPYMTNKAAFLERIAEMVNDKKLEGISDLRDESDRDGVRVVVDLKRDANPEVVLNNLYQKTGLQVNFAGNMVALMQNGTQPNRINLKEALQSFIQFRFQTIRRRSNYQLQKLLSRDHIVLGLMQAMHRIDEIIAITKSSSDTATAKQKIMSLSITNKDDNNSKEQQTSFSNEQAEAILSLTLRRLTALEEKKLEEEHEDLSHRIQQLQKTLKEDKEVYKIMKTESLHFKKKYGKPRQSTIIEAEAKELSQEDLLANERSIIIVTQSGYIKRVPIATFEAQSRGGRGKTGAKLSDKEDVITHFISCKDHDNLIFVSDSGVAYGIKAYEVPLSARTAKGTPIPQVVTMRPDEKISSFFAVDKFDDRESILLLSQQGQIKKIPLTSVRKITSRGLLVIGLRDGDCLLTARRCKEKDEIVIGTRNGYCLRFSAQKLRQSGRGSLGVKSIRLRQDDSIADCDVVSAEHLSEDTQMVLVTDKGFGKRVALSHIVQRRRGNTGIIAIKFKPKLEEDRLRSLRVSTREKDELVLSTGKGTITRLRVKEISTQGRTAKGVKLQNIPDDDFLAKVDIIPPEDVKEGDEDLAYRNYLIQKPSQAGLADESHSNEGVTTIAEEALIA